MERLAASHWAVKVSVTWPLTTTVYSSPGVKPLHAVEHSLTRVDVHRVEAEVSVHRTSSVLWCAARSLHLSATRRTDRETKLCEFSRCGSSNSYGSTIKTKQAVTSCRRTAGHIWHREQCLQIRLIRSIGLSGGGQEHQPLPVRETIMRDGGA